VTTQQTIRHFLSSYGIRQGRSGVREIASLA
jgi:hypothetical protein